LLFAQNNDSRKNNFPDSLKINLQQNPLTELQIKFDEFEIHRELNNIKMNIPIDGDPNTVWLRTSLAIIKIRKTQSGFFTSFFITA
jgi:hypothetical protein